MAANNRFVLLGNTMLTGKLHTVKPTCTAPLVYLSISPIRIELVFYIRSKTFRKARNPSMNKYIVVGFIIIHASGEKLLVKRRLHYPSN